MRRAAAFTVSNAPVAKSSSKFVLRSIAHNVSTSDGEGISGGIEGEETDFDSTLRFIGLSILWQFMNEIPGEREQRDDRGEKSDTRHRAPARAGW